MMERFVLERLRTMTSGPAVGDLVARDVGDAELQHWLDRAVAPSGSSSTRSSNPQSAWRCRDVSGWSWAERASEDDGPEGGVRRLRLLRPCRAPDGLGRSRGGEDARGDGSALLDHRRLPEGLRGRQGRARPGEPGRGRREFHGRPADPLPPAAPPPGGMPVTARGDPAQLGPIGFGLTLHAFSDMEWIPKVRLTRIYRQAESSGIPVVAASVRDGRLPRLPAEIGCGHGVVLVATSDEPTCEDVVDAVAALGGFRDDLRILSPCEDGARQARSR